MTKYFQLVGFRLYAYSLSSSIKYFFFLDELKLYNLDST